MLNVPAALVAGAATLPFLAVACLSASASAKGAAKSTTATGYRPATTSPWPSLRQRFKALVAEAYAELVTDIVVVAHRALPPPLPGIPSFTSRVANLLLAWIAVCVSCIGTVERLLGYGGGLPVHEIREASLDEMRTGLGRLSGKNLLPSAYEAWDGPRNEGRLALRYQYHANRLQALLVAANVPCAKTVRCEPFSLDAETREWVRRHVVRPAAPSRLHVWRALKRRLYHYDAGVVAFRGFPRNFLLSAAQWAELLGRPEGHGKGLALDIGAGDGSLNDPMRGLFARVVATELTTPLVLRLRAAGLDAVVAEDPIAEDVFGHLRGVAQADAVLILNVLDRCKDPFRMLDQARALLAPDGRLVISVVLPATQSDAALGVGSSQRRWNVDGDTFEAATASLVQHVVVPSGFEPLRIVRAPYFCAGDRNSPVAALDACVMVLRHTAA